MKDQVAPAGARGPGHLQMGYSHIGDPRARHDRHREPPARAIRKTPDSHVVGKSQGKEEIQTVAGTGPMVFSTGIIQYRQAAYQPMRIPVTRPAATPTKYPVNKRIIESIDTFGQKYPVRPQALQDEVGSGKITKRGGERI